MFSEWTREKARRVNRWVEDILEEPLSPFKKMSERVFWLPEGGAFGRYEVRGISKGQLEGVRELCSTTPPPSWFFNSSYVDFFLMQIKPKSGELKLLFNLALADSLFPHPATKEVDFTHFHNIHLCFLRYTLTFCKTGFGVEEDINTPPFRQKQIFQFKKIIIRNRN